jgi:hypothetical protein
MNLADLMIAPFDASHRLDFDHIQILNRNCYDALTDAPGIGGRSAVWRTLRYRDWLTRPREELLRPTLDCCRGWRLCPAEQFPAIAAFLDLVPDVFAERSGTLAQHPAAYLGRKPNVFRALGGSSFCNIRISEID